MASRDEKGSASPPKSADNPDRREEAPVRALQTRGKAPSINAKKAASPRDFFKQIRLPGFEKRSSTAGDTVKICCISSPLRVEEFGPRGRALDLRLTTHGEHRVTELARDLGDWREERLIELKSALAHGPDIVSFSELAYPPIRAGGGQHANDDDEFTASVLATLVEHNSQAFVFCGSHHSREKQNVGVIFPYGQTGFQDEDGHADHIRYIKRVSTRSLGERAVEAPEAFRPPAIQRREGYVTVAMSSEIFDFEHAREIALRNVNESGGHTKVDLVVVPSFAADANEPIDAMCRYLSRWTATTVVHVNANTLDDGFPQAAVYVCGVRLTRGDRPDLLKEEEQQQVALPSGAASTLHIFTLDRDLVDIERRLWIGSDEMRRFLVPVNIGGAKLTA